MVSPMAIKSIVTNEEKLKLVSSPILDSKDFYPLIDDLLDTAIDSSKKGIGCVGLASNQIGILQRAIVVFVHGKWIIMINPKITVNLKAGKSNAKEMCLSRPGIKSFRKRYKKISVSYEDENSELHDLKLSRMNARIVQHEVDHLDGVYI